MNKDKRIRYLEAELKFQRGQIRLLRDELLKLQKLIAQASISLPSHPPLLLQFDEQANL